MNDFASIRAMILAAGFGTRLYPLTLDRAKPAIPFLNRPLVGYTAEYLARYGCREVGVNLHHESESVRRALGDGSRFGVNFNYFEEPEILGTSGALANAREFLEGGTFIVINGKIVTDIDLSLALATHRRMNALATLILRPNPRRERFSIVHTTPENLITGFGGMPAHGSDNGLMFADNSERIPLMFTGIQILEPEIFAYIPPAGFSHTTTDVYPQAMARGERIAAHIAEGVWYELSTIERYLDISVAMMRRENLGFICGEGSVIRKDALIEDTVMWEGVYVGEEARLSECVVGDGVRIPDGEEYTRAAIVRGELVADSERPPKALAGEFVGNNFVVPLP
jgi:NDP-sugar pyrophosphorylase family protein